jgi:hypothetical protein
VHAFPEAGLGVAVAVDSLVIQSEVYAASNALDESPRRQDRPVWGGRAVLVLIGHRLGLDCVNPIYYDTIKVRMTLFLALFSEFNKNRPGIVYVPTVCGHRWRAAVFFVLLCRVPGR